LLANAKDVSVQGVAKAGILQIKGSEVRLLKRDELDPAWDIRTDTKVTVWECCQHLIRRLEGEGEESAAQLLKTLSHYGDLARERKRWAEEARAYNGLIVAWPHIERLAEQVAASPLPGRDERQRELAV
jgi:putative DNA methylase